MRILSTKKEKNDAAKGKIFTIIGREIAVAVKDGGPDPANNFKLAQVIAKAKASNMPMIRLSVVSKRHPVKETLSITSTVPMRDMVRVEQLSS